MSVFRPDTAATPAPPRMNIILFSSSRNTSGGSRQALYLAQGLGERGHNVLFFVPEKNRLSALAPDWPHWRFLKGGKWRWRAQIEAAMPAAGGPYVFHAFHNAAVKLAAWWGLFWRKRAVVVAHRGVLFRPNNPLPYWLPGIDLFMVNSEACARVLRKIGLSAGRVVYVPNSIPDSRIAPVFPLGHARAALGIEESALVFVCIGGNKPVKGIEPLIRAFAAAFAPPAPESSGSAARLESGPPLTPIHLVLVGVDPELWLPLCAEVGMAGRIHCVPPTEAIADYLAAGSVFVLPSLSESMPNTLLEAVRAGLPAIGTEVGAVPDILRECGLLVSPGDVRSLAGAMRRLADEPDLRARLAAKTREQERLYRPENRLDQVERLYGDCLRQKGFR